MKLTYKHIPNILTCLRLVLTVLFILVLAQYRYQVEGPINSWALLVSLVIFIVAAVTDALDGYFARRWQAESMFGRIMDPFCDKVLVLGAFIMLAGGAFSDPLALAQGHWQTMVSGVYPWMVVVILGRELLVTSMRGQLESQGVKFSAQWFGKWKMILQSVVIPVVLVIVWWSPQAQTGPWLQIIRDSLIYLTVLVTVLSGWPYLTAAVKSMKSPHPPA